MEKSHSCLFIWVIIISLTFSSCNRSTSVSSPSSPPASPVTEVPKTNRLAWIKSSNDFNQNSLTSEEIDRRISQIIQQAVESNSLTADIEIPINSQKLDYLGYVNPFTLDELKNGDGNRADLAHYDKSLHVYKYGDIYISTQGDTQTDQMNVYYTARALEILKTRYPEAYKNLFVDSKQFLANEPKYGQWLNKNKAFWIGFNTNPTGFSSNNHFFISEPQVAGQNFTRSVNIAVINIHESKILGQNPNAGSRPVYNRNTDKENYSLHMREGLMVSIVHEMLHNYIQYAASVSDKFQKASSMRGNQDGNDTEEAVVVNTVYQYFRKKGGLLPDQYNYYYHHIFDKYMTNLTNKNLLINYATYYSNVAPTQTNLRDVFIISGILN